MQRPLTSGAGAPFGRLAGALSALCLALQAQAADIRTGLKAYWNFDQKDFQDAIGIYDGTENGDAPIEFVPGKSGFGQAIQMLGPSDSGGANQYVEITGGEPDDLAFENGSMSVSLWFTVDTWDKSWQAVCAKGEGNNWRIHRRGTENVMGFTGGAGGDTPSGTKAVNDGLWHHLVAISDAENLVSTLWIDGEVDATRDIGALSANGQRMMIGENPDARNRYWHGLIDDVAVWDRPLSDTEVASLYNNGTGKPLSDLLAPKGDADNDGMPDEWETQFAACCGLNPNDASDAAKDCNNNGFSNLQEYQNGLDPCNTTRPAVVSAAATATFDTVQITFSEALDPASATVVGNYAISPALAVTAASYRNKVVTLTTAAQAPGGTAYTVTVTGVKNLSNWEVASGSNSTKFFSYMMSRSGVLEFNYWDNISGTAVANLYADLRFPASPTSEGAVYSFNSRDIFPDDSHENYGATMEGFITPAESGDYRFFIYTDDASQLFLRPDETLPDPFLDFWIAEEPGCCNNFSEPGAHTRTSEPVSLVAGRKYGIMLVYKEGGGGDYGQVAWRKEGDPTPAASLTPIPGTYLSAAKDLPFPAEGIFTTRSPGPNAANVKPNAGVTIVHLDGKSPWTAQNTSLKFDGVAVTPTFAKSGAQVTMTYQPPALLASESTHTVTLGYPDPTGAPASLEWSFQVVKYAGPVKDSVEGYEGLILGSAVQTDDQGGFSGQAGDRAIDFGTGSGQSVLIYDATFLNAPAAGDKMTFTVWAKKYDIANNSVFWADSPSSSSGQRGFQAHLPWSDNNIYFDTVGCCDGTTQRINLSIDNFAGYTGDVSWWNEWRHYAFVKDAGHKQIWIDGQLFHEGDNSNPLPTDFQRIWVGAEGGGPNAGTANNLHGLVDEFAVFGSALAEADIAKLAAGDPASSLGAGAALVAYWKFDDVAAAAPTISVMRTATGLEITFTGRLQSADSVAGPYADVAGATSPATIQATGPAKFYRSAQ